MKQFPDSGKIKKHEIMSFEYWKEGITKWHAVGVYVKITNTLMDLRNSKVVTYYHYLSVTTTANLY